MKKFTTVLSIAALLINMVALTGCKPNGEVSDTPTDSGDSSSITDSTDNSSNSDSSSAPESAPEPPKPAGEPTFLTAPDGTPIYTSEISEVYSGSEQFDNKKTITLAEAEQIAQTGDGDFTVKCDGFVYGYIPEKALNRIETPEMFKDSGDGRNFKYLGKLSDEESGYDRRLTDLTLIKPGDKFGELTVKNAYTLFTNNKKTEGKPHVPGAHINDGCIEFDGAIELEGYICVNPMETFYGEGGDMEFFPNGDSSTKLPCVSPGWDRESNEYYAASYSHYYGFFGDWERELKLGNMFKVECDTSGLEPGDSFVKVKVVLDNVKYVPGNFAGWEVNLKSIEVLNK